MKVSELIKKLELLKEQSGDGKIYCFDEDGYVQDVKEVYALAKRKSESAFNIMIE